MAASSSQFETVEEGAAVAAALEAAELTAAAEQAVMAAIAAIEAEEAAMAAEARAKQIPIGSSPLLFSNPSGTSAPSASPSLAAGAGAPSTRSCWRRGCF